MPSGSGDTSHSMLRNLIASLTRRKSAKTLARRLAVAQAALVAGEYELAEPEFLSLAKADPRNGEVWLHAGLCAAQRGDLHLALKHFDNACECSPTDHQTLYRRGETLAALGRHAEAIAGCHAIIAMAPKFDPGFTLLASLLLPGESYLVVLPRLHAFLRPATYLEIGVFRGTSFQHVLPDTRAIGIDPAPQITEPVPRNGRVVVMTSDEFFATHDVRAEFGGDVHHDLGRARGRRQPRLGGRHSATRAGRRTQGQQPGLGGPAGPDMTPPRAATISPDGVPFSM